MNLIHKLGNIIGGLFLVWAGLVLNLLYFEMQKKAGNSFISFLLFVFFFGLGIGGIILGLRRTILTLIRKKPTPEIKT